MPRVHLFELEDLPWVPRVWRDGATDVLHVLFAVTRMYQPAAGVIDTFMTEVGLRRWFDLCSGAGGGAVTMREAIAAAGGGAVDVTLSDRFPNEAARARLAAATPPLTYRPDPVDARHVPPHDGAIRTMFGALHHFEPAEVSAILQDAVRASVPIAFVDVAASPALRRLPAVLLPLAAVPNLLLLCAAVLLLAPTVRPFRWSRLFWTYVVPAIPLLFAWDGTVSALRAYTPEEVLALARSVPGAEAYAWRADRAGRLLYLTGRAGFDVADRA